MAEVALSGVGKTYDKDVVAVTDASFTVANEEFLVLVGPSGCGKSTLLRMIAGLESVTTGTISIDGRVVNEVAPRDRDIAMVFQNYALYPHMNVFDNMAMGLRIRRMNKTEMGERVRDAARLLGIEALLERRPAKLSGGQRQRVALGRAIVRRPKVFLFDEPLSNLDAKLRVEMRTEIAKLHRDLRATMIYVTHDQTEAMTMGDRIVVMRDGVIQQVDGPLELYNRPTNRFVASFLGSPPINLWSARFDLENRRLDLEAESTTLEGDIPSDLGSLDGKSFTVGLRPEDIHLRPSQSRLRATLATTLEVVEPLGSETLVYWRTKEGARGVARVEASDAVRAGMEADLHADLDHAHFFDAANESTLLSWPGA